MNKLKIWICLFIFVAALVLPGVAYASSPQQPLLDDKVVIFGTFTLNEGETLAGNLIVLGGVVNLEIDSIVIGDVVVFGGNVTVDGEITKNLVAVGGVVVLNGTAVVRGDLIAPATVVRRDENAKVYGQLITENVPFEITQVPEITLTPAVPEVPEAPQSPEVQPANPFWYQVSDALKPVVDFFSTLVRALLLSAVAVLILLFLPKPGQRVAKAIQEYPVLSGGLGLLSLVAAAPIMLLLTITIILIPVTILFGLGLMVGLFFGLIVVGAEIGRRMAEAFGQHWSATLQAALGMFTLVFFLGLFGLVLWDWIASLLWVMVASIGLGAVLLTRFGTREYVSIKARPVASARQALPVEAEAKPVEVQKPSEPEPTVDTAPQGEPGEDIQPKPKTSRKKPAAKKPDEPEG